MLGAGLEKEREAALIPDKFLQISSFRALPRVFV